MQVRNGDKILISFDFYEYETKSTTPVEGPHAVFNYIARYNVDITDFPIKYLQNEELDIKVLTLVVSEDDEDDADDEDLPPAITVGIETLELVDKSPTAHDPHVQMEYLSFELLAFHAAELETESYAKQSILGQPCDVGYRRTFQLPYGTPSRNLLRKIKYDELTSPGGVTVLNDPRDISFFLVSEPADDEVDAECEDLAVGSLVVAELLSRNEHTITQSLDLYSVTKPEVIVGKLNVSISGLPDCVRAIANYEDAQSRFYTVDYNSQKNS
eukprot:Clim_evm17s147 gene=Clim_evmTU17s147